MEVKIKRLTETSKLPTRGSEMAAGYDLYADLDMPVRIKPHKTKLIPTGISIAVPEGYFGGIYARSGLAMKQGLRPANCVGVIDADYRGPVGVAIYNDKGKAVTICAGERIAQLVIQPCMDVTWEETGELDGTGRGEGGFGSTGNR